MTLTSILHRYGHGFGIASYLFGETSALNVSIVKLGLAFYAFQILSGKKEACLQYGNDRFLFSRFHIRTIAKQTSSGFLPRCLLRFNLFRGCSCLCSQGFLSALCDNVHDQYWPALVQSANDSSTLVLIFLRIDALSFDSLYPIKH